jgi:hypothetical protein
MTQSSSSMPSIISPSSQLPVATTAGLPSAAFFVRTADSDPPQAASNTVAPTASAHMILCVFMTTFPLSKPFFFDKNELPSGTLQDHQKQLSSGISGNESQIFSVRKPGSR